LRLLFLWVVRLLLMVLVLVLPVWLALALLLLFRLCLVVVVMVVVMMRWGRSWLSRYIAMHNSSRRCRCKCIAVVGEEE
jgi:hypothetical protein